MSKLSLITRTTHVLRGSLQCAVHDQRGSIAVTFGISLIPITLAVGAAVDFSRASSAKAKLDALADAAALTAVNKTAMSMTAAAAKSQAEKIFNSQAALISGVNVAAVQVTVSEGTTRSAVVTYSATQPTVMMGLVGMSTMTLKGEATAASAVPSYIDFYLLLDNSPSMGVAATPSDITKMVNATTDKCAFACHDQSDTNNYYNLAKKIGVTMRVDVLRQATQRLMDTAATTRQNTNQFKMAIYTLGDSCEQIGLNKITSLTSNLSKAKSDASKIDLMTIPYQNYSSDQCTNFDAALSAADKTIDKPGDGSSSSKAQKILFFVSDGVADANNPSSCSRPLSGSTRCQEPLDVSFCSTIKKRGIKIAVLYTTYLPLPTNPWYNTWIAPFSSQIGPNMETCASPGLYFEVSPSQGISDAMNALFEKVVTQARLTR